MVVWDDYLEAHMEAGSSVILLHSGRWPRPVETETWLDEALVQRGIISIDQQSTGNWESQVGVHITEAMIEIKWEYIYLFYYFKSNCVLLN